MGRVSQENAREIATEGTGRTRHDRIIFAEKNTMEDVRYLPVCIYI